MIDWRKMLLKPWAIATGMIAAAGVAVKTLPNDTLFILLAVLVAVAIGFVVLWLLRRWREGRQSAQFRAGLNQNASKAPGNINDPTRRVELDGLRQKFNDGFHRVVEEGRRKGVDFLYRHPWIMVVGEPGSGKTEAIRHSGIVSPRMQDELQGVGGTLNMDWWFTERAVILDTAGRMVFEEEAGTANNEFQEFLRLLRRGRKLTPINGLLVTVSADTLVGGTDDEIRERSTKLAEKIAQIQSVLEVRFPVYVVVTKCDKITGFREFFENLDEPAKLNQILGWSNPEGLDVAFNPERVEEHLAGVIDTLRAVRFKLLDRPVGQGGTKRRTDEVDSLYAFPHGLQMLSTRLKLYLEPVFAAGEWSASAPLFVRGVYFSSALWQGAVLDQELAAALGVAVDTLGDEGKVFRRDRALFLRDLFVEKMLPERGLVTTSHRTEGIVFKRRVITWSTLAAVLLLGIGAIAWTYSSLMTGDLANEVALWKLARANRTTAGVAPLIVRNEQSGQWEYAGKQVMRAAGDEKSSEGDSKALTKERLAFHTQLEANTRREIKASLFSPVANDLNVRRRAAQNKMLVVDLVQPVLAATRERISSDRNWDEKHTQILSALLQFETTFHLEAAKRNLPSSESFLAPMLRFGVGAFARSHPEEKGLFALFSDSYNPPNPRLRPEWPPARLSAGFSLNENKAIAQAVRNLNQHRRDKADTIAKSIASLNALRDALIEFRDFEKKLVGSSARTLDQWKTDIARYGELRIKVDTCLKECAANSASGAGFSDMDAAIDPMRVGLQTEKQALRGKVLDEAIQLAGSPARSAVPSEKFELLKNVDAELGAVAAGESKRVTDAFPEIERVKLRALDQRYLRADSAGVRRFEVWPELFKSLISSASASVNPGEPRLIGNFARIDGRIVEAAGAEKVVSLAVDPSKPTAPVSDPLLVPARELLVSLYEDEYNKFLDGYIGFPLVADRTGKTIEVGDLDVIRRRLLKIKDDGEYLKTAAGSGRITILRGRLERCLEQINRVLPALIGGEGEIAMVKVQYPEFAEQTGILRNFDPALQHVDYVWRQLRAGVRRWGTKEARDIGDFQVASTELRLSFYFPSEDNSEGLIDKVQVAPLANWDLFRRILDPQLPSPTRSDDRRRLSVLFFRQDDEKVKYGFVLAITLAHALPDRANWPKFSSLRNP